MKKYIAPVVRVLLIGVVLTGGFLLGGLRGVAYAIVASLALWGAIRLLIHVFNQVNDNSPVTRERNNPPVSTSPLTSRFFTIWVSLLVLCGVGGFYLAQGYIGQNLGAILGVILGGLIGFPWCFPKGQRCLKIALWWALSVLLALAMTAIVLWIGSFFDLHVNRYSGLIAMLFAISLPVIHAHICPESEGSEPPSQPSCH